MNDLFEKGCREKLYFDYKGRGDCSLYDLYDLDRPALARMYTRIEEQMPRHETKGLRSQFSDRPVQKDRMTMLNELRLKIIQRVADQKEIEARAAEEERFLEQQAERLDTLASEAQLAAQRTVFEKMTPAQLAAFQKLQTFPEKKAFLDEMAAKPAEKTTTE